MKRKIELLAPGGDIDSIKAAILAGADAIYCGLDRFNARNRATNISLSDLRGILKLAHKNNCEVFITLNIIIIESEISAIIDLLNKLIKTSIDGIIVQDLGLLYLLSKYFKKLKIHASTQLTTHNLGQIKFLSELKSTRVNLSRELNIHEIKLLTSYAHKNNVLTEVFVQGSNCICFSGICYMSSVQTGNSGNRGRCSQPCRDRYATTAMSKDYPINLKDNSAFFDLEKLYHAGVDSLKIEGRIKKYDYVYTVVNTWKKQINSFCQHNKITNDNSSLYQVFNRDFSNTFLTGDIHKDMFIDNPRDHSILNLSEKNNYSSAEEKEKSELQFYQEKDLLKQDIKNKIDLLNIDKTPLNIYISGKQGLRLIVTVKTPNTSFVLHSDSTLHITGAQPLDKEVILKRFKAVNNTEYYIQHLDTKDIQGNVYIPFKELTALKNQLLFTLNHSNEIVPSVVVPKLKETLAVIRKPTLSVLISSVDDVHLRNNSSSIDIYFQLPSGFKDQYVELIQLFTKNKKLTPWFPSIIIGEDYNAAIKFLDEIKPNRIVTNNTGIAYEAYVKGINWIAGPYLNIVNSYSLLCLKEKLNCTGSFISNEINKIQIKNIKCPENFNLYYSIFHPIALMSSRQCLFHQVTGCHKHKIDDSCIQHCEKSAFISNSKNKSFFIEKSKGQYHHIYNNTHFLNADITTDIPNFFSGYFIDLRDVKTDTKTNKSKSALVALFENYINGTENADEKIKQHISPTSYTQYIKGI